MNNITTTSNSPFNPSLINPSLKMSSLELAELTEKQHLHVMRDIRNLIEQEALTESNFGFSEYKDASGKMNPMYLLDFDATMLLITGYDPKRRMLVIKRWRQLETGEALPGITEATLESIVQRVVAMARPLIQAQQASGQFIETSGVSNYLAWLPHELKKDSFTTKFDLYDMYSLYCSETNTSQDPAPHFFTKLYRCLPSLKSARILVGGRRTPVVIGISILLGDEVQ